jgi:hypothetical protein
VTEALYPVPGYSGLSVTRTGVVYGPQGRPLTPALNYRDQLMVSCSRRTPEGRLKASVAEILCAAFHGPRPSPDHWAKTLNGNPYDKRPENVAWVLKKSAQKGA